MQNKRSKPSLSERGKTPMDAALKHLAPRMRSVREMELYLDQQQYGEYEISQVIDRLTELGYLNDEAFAIEFVRTRLATKPVSRWKLQSQLKEHFLPDSVIESALSAVPDMQEKENALAMAKKYAPQMMGLPLQEQKDRLMRRLLGRGYSCEDAKEAVQAALMEET